MSIAVIGTIFMDCKAFAGSSYDPIGRNVGTVKFIHGGVGRNVAENLARLGAEPVFVSSADDKPVADAVLARLEACGADTRHVVRNSNLGVWSVILNEDGEQLGAVSQPPDTAALELYFRESGGAIIAACDAVALEFDLSAPLSRMAVELAQRQHKPVYALPANLDILPEVEDLLPRLDLFICNDIEISRILSLDLRGRDREETLALLAPEARRRGLRSLVVTLGSRGCVYIDALRGECGSCPAIPTEVRDVTGAGDAFFSGAVAALMAGKPLSAAVRVGTRLASLTIACDENNCRPPEDILD